MVRLTGMLPIRKIDPTTVALSTYFGKNFVTRGRRKSDSYADWVISKVEAAGLGDDPYITKVSPGMVFDPSFKAPYIYGALASRFKTVTAGRYILMFNHRERLSLVSPEIASMVETEGRIIVGTSNKGNAIVIDPSGEFWLFDPTSQAQWVSLGDIFGILDLPAERAPVDFTEVRIFSKTVPVGLVMGYLIGWHALLKMMGVKYRIVEGRRQRQMTKDEYVIAFKDQSYIFDRRDVKSSLIIAGLTAYERQLRQYDVADFDHRDVYLNLLASKGLGSLYIRELELSDQMFVDAISRSILTEMHEPVTFRGLLMRATEMLIDYHHPDPQDMSQMRIRGYERISGFAYKELVTSIRSFRNRNISGRSKIEMGPYQVYSNIMRDPTIKSPEEINPIQSLKETEVVTYVGEGGRGKESMNKASRAYHPNDRGVISEGTVDSGDVGVNIYLSANPNFRNLRGQTYNTPDTNSANLLTTSSNLGVGSNGDY
jgi:hypothetical protein